MLVRRNQQAMSGFTLVEVLIALLVGSLVMIGLISFFYNITENSKSTLSAGRLDRELNSVMEIITGDIHRAGYWATADAGGTNPFMVDSDTDIAVNAGNNCITLTYDADGDGALPSISAAIDDERYGYRLDAANNVIQFRPAGAVFDCATAAANWNNLTDPNVINVTAFTVTKNTNSVAAGAGSLELRTIDITLTGELASDATITKTITKTVKVYNDRYIAP